MGPGLSPLSNPDDSYYAYFDPSSTDSGQHTFNMLRDYLRDQGLFDGVIGFSQGACLAVAYIAAGERLGLSRQIHPSFKCAVFISSMSVPDAVAFNLRGEIRLIDPGIDGELIRIPTVHIWGAEHVYSKHCYTVRRICDQQTVSSFIHGGGHEVPGSGAQEAVIETVKAL
ncbi:hypothetical protein BCON_0238g00020 [Botryotinia convoluta]|uniref:Serine hydrolase domain-containing protein n=1 Tax=Botryotinia convoluta TaxID=54673 RepID=A0A4Z1HMI3_9HELO|nr:hypothetical protein BCON_0238g00020 [Botryotinia convoluta]